MLACDLGRGLLMAAVAALALRGRLTVELVYVASFAFGMADAFFQPAYTAAVPALVPPPLLASANALAGLSLQLGRIAGPPLGAAVLTAAGAAAAFGLDGLSFVASAAVLLRLAGTVAAPRAPAERPPAVAEALREGFAAVRGSPWLATSIVVQAFANALLAGAYTVALPFLIRGDLGGGVGMLGLFFATFAVGYVLGGAWATRSEKRRRRGVQAYLALALAGLGMLALALPLPLPLRLLAALVNGAGLEVFGVVWTTSLQETVPPERLGRVASIDAFGSFLLLPVGFAAAGWATGHLGAPMVCALGGGGTAALALLALLRPAVRGFE